MKIVKNVFKFRGPNLISKSVIDNLIDMCTVDGSSVHKVRIDYEYARAWGEDNKVIIWTRKGTK